MTSRAQRERRKALLAMAVVPSALAAWTQQALAPSLQTATVVPPAPTDAPPEPTPLPAPSHPVLGFERLEFGVVGHLFYTDRDRVLALTGIAGFDWFRQQLHWRDIEDSPGHYVWDEIDRIVESVAAAGIRLLVNVVRSPDFYGVNGGKPRDPEALAALFEQLARRYGRAIGAYEIWNEPNLAVENGGRITVEDAGNYVETLAACYRRIKAIDPTLIVVAAAPSSTGVTSESLAIDDQEYLRLLYGYRDGMIREYFDVQAVHPGAAANDPDWLYPEQPGDRPGWNDHPTHYFRHVENTRALMLEYGLGDRQIWLTEYGWATPNNTPGFEYGQLISLERQADYVSRAVERAYARYRDEQGRPWLSAMFLWNMNFAVLWGGEGNPEHEQASFGILAPDWSPRPTFIALQGLHQRLKAEQGRA
ncbi:MAG: cellulase family glycosylhydrolase [Chloroflexi bacterium]|nr:cellulase family glycosylhydrolase [Chloroflexota bacterium]